MIKPKPVIQEKFEFNHEIILYSGKCRDYLKQLPDNLISLIITSPPYNIGKKYEKIIDIQDYLNEQKEIISELKRILKDNGSICWQVGNYVNKGEVFPLDIYYYQIFKNLDFKLRNRIIWRFGHGLHASKRFSGRYETILWFTKSDNYIFNLDEVRIPSKYPGKRHYKGEKKGQISGNPKGKNPSDYWEIIIQDWEQEIWDIPNVKSNHPEKTIHPCQYPIELVERCILALTNEDDWIFDPYAGVASSLIAGIKHNRKVMGCEKEIEYLTIAKERINSYLDGTLKIRPLGKPVFTPTGREKITQIPEEWQTENINSTSQLNLFN
jgi:DNA modification methylase